MALGPRSQAPPSRACSSRSIACAAPIFHLIRPSFSSPGSLAAFKLSHKIYLLFHEYISSRQAQAFYIFTLYIFHGRLIAVSEAERGRGEGTSRRSRQLAAEGGRQQRSIGYLVRARGAHGHTQPKHGTRGYRARKGRSSWGSRVRTDDHCSGEAKSMLSTEVLGCKPPACRLVV